jgi:hypothetical protein
MRKLEELKKYPKFPPKRTYVVGQKVWFTNGMHKDVEIIEKVDDHIYKVKYTVTNNNYGKISESEAEGYALWYQMSDKKPHDKEHFNKRKENFLYRISFHNTRMSELLNRGLSGIVNMEPEYQRGYVWSLEDKVKLIDSVFKNIEIGKFAFVSLGYETDIMFEILDGKQRLTALMEFRVDQFQYKGKYYSELSVEDQKYFNQVNVTMGDSDNELKLIDKYRYFLRLNVGGVQQSEEHLQLIKDKIKELEE